MKHIILSIILLIALLVSGCSGAVIETTSQSPTPTASITHPTPTTPQKVVRFFIAIHCEPGSDPHNTAYAELNWPALVQLVAAADEAGQKLNLLFNPQWATYILADSIRLELVREWEANGHEIGLHHHGPHMNDWNGYTDQPAYFSDHEFIGTINQMMDLMNQLPVSGQIRIAAVTDDDAPDDYPAGIVYDVDGGWNGVDDLVNCPSFITWNNHELIHLTHARYAANPGGINVSLGEIEQAINSVTEHELIGIVFHTFEYAANADVFDELFTFLKLHGVYAKAVPDLFAGDSILKPR